MTKKTLFAVTAVLAAALWGAAPSVCAAEASLPTEARANGSEPVPMEVYVISNEKRTVENLSVPADGWHRVSRDIDFDFDLAATDLIAVFLRIKISCA